MNLTVAHYLNVYKARKRMQDEGVTKPREAIKALTKDIVDKLSKRSLEDEIALIRRRNIMTMEDANG